MKLDHTPGPWKYHRTHTASSSYWYVIADANGYGPIVDVGGKDLSGQIAEAKHLITDPKIIEANARLIAAAPEMLEALIKAKEFIQNGIEFGYITMPDIETDPALKTPELIQKAIDKALG